MFYTLFPQERPDMAIPSSQKGKDYCLRFGRHFASGVNVAAIQKMQQKSIMAERAYAGDIIQQEDIDMYMMDESQNSRNRVMWDFNMVKPLIEQFRGSAIQSSFNATVQTVSKHQARSRRQAAMAQQVLMYELAQTSQTMGRVLGEPNGVGKSLQETMGIFENSYEDPYIRASNHLLERSAAICDFDRYKGDDAYRFAFCGVLPEIMRTDGSFVTFQRIHPRDFFWDTSARNPDFSDASFMGVAPLMGMPEIAQHWQISQDELQAIESSLRHAFYNFATGTTGTFSLLAQNKVRAISIYWKDEATYNFGYINGDGDVPTLVKVGEEDGGKLYSENDLIEPPDNEDNRKAFKGGKTARKRVERVMFVDFVPWENMAGCNFTRFKDQAKDLPDLVLDYGVYELQPYNPFDINRIQLPIVATAYAFADGEIVSPVQAVLDPNRFVARITGSIEAMVNQSGGKTPVVDMDVVDPSLSVDDVDVYRKQGRTIPLRNGGRGVGNAIGSHDDSPGQGAYAMLQIINAAQDMVRTITGVHAPMTGESQKDQLVGVTEILVQRGAIMQEPFYDALSDLYLRKYRLLATAGKEYYLEHPDVLLDLVSEDDLIPLYFTEDFAMERLNATVQRDNPERTRRQAANQWLDQLMQLGLIDRKRYFDLYNRSYVEDIAPALRQYAAELEQAEMEAQREAQRQQMLAGLQQERMRLAEKEDEVLKDELDVAKTAAKEGVKAESNRDRENVKHANKMEQMGVEASLQQPGVL